ncbi:FAD-dependent monooxygenase [Pelagibacterium luteolum]|uniref:2-polyprenyl-6-methoxyphenol hydroxylase n=1 Tax=Pelagibacterium luteolum TaxID=440168 RepID=A0A1G7SXY7_9HYPH|nr:FAD-dependent monooxygenase [Pelagibacterium luteolum]SDG27289.1 2-polyprenyl-6-methoxyphenol hydroxylase [Pelagibacterium luteolum]
MTAQSRASAEVLIVGGGPVGMGLAIELGQRGITVLVVEKYPSPQPVPKGQNLTQRTMEHFHFWGIEDQLRAARTIPRDYGIGGLTAYGTLLGDYHYDWLQRELVRPYYYTDNERLPQYATEAVLRARAAQLPSVTTLFGWSCIETEQNAASASATIVNRETGEQKIVSALYLVGCDGSKSVVRESAGIVQDRSDHDRLMVLLVFKSKTLHDLLARFPGKSFYNVLHPDLEGYWQFFGRVDLGDTWFFHAPVPLGTTEDNFDFASYLHKAVGAEFDVSFDHIGFWDLRVAIARNYNKGRIFIAGDAAHSHPPYGGYGINTGLEDARNLGWKLAATIKGWAGEELLATYDEERRPVFASTAKDFIEKSIENDKAFLAAFNPKHDRAAFEAEWTSRGSGARGEVNAYEPNYAGSSIVFGPNNAICNANGTHSDVARPGHHLTPKTLSDGRNIYEALGSGYTLLALGEDNLIAAEFAQAASILGIPLTVIADHGEGECGLYGAHYILIRPDQFVSWTGNSVSPGEASDILARAVAIDRQANLKERYA